MLFLDTVTFGNFMLPILFGTNELFSPVSEGLAIIMASLGYLVAASFYVVLTISIVVKYFSIYHGATIDDLDEDWILPRIKLILFTVPTLAGILDYTLLIDIEDTEFYQLVRYGKANQDVKVGYLMNSMLLVAFTSTLGLQIRLEYDYIRLDESNGFINFLKTVFKARHSETVDESGYKISVTRVITVLGLIMVVLSIPTTWINVNGKYVIIVFDVLFGFICPLVFICTHPGIKNQCLKLIPKICRR